MLRVGWGFDVHPLGGDKPLILGGCRVEGHTQVEATSDGDVVAHAVIDALLGAANLDDLGAHFPSSDDRWRGADSLGLLARSVIMAASVGCVAIYVDVTVIAQDVRIAPIRSQIRAGLARALELDLDHVSVKATTTDYLGVIGRNEAIAAAAVVTAEVTA